MPNASRYRYSLLHRLIVNSINTALRVRATLPVDYIYSVLSISSDFDGAVTKAHIDYSIPWEEVYSDYAEHLLEKEGGVFLGLGGIDSPHMLPSWAPDWSVPMQRLSLCWREDTASSVTPAKLYSAGGPSSRFSCRSCGRSSTPRTITVEGFEIDCISTNGTANDRFSHLNDSEYQTPWVRNWMFSFDAFREKFIGRTSDQLEQTPWKIPIADQYRHDDTNLTVRAHVWMADA